MLFTLQYFTVLKQSSFFPQTLMRHTFMQISSCGSSYEREGYFGYIAGSVLKLGLSWFLCMWFFLILILLICRDESCNIAKEFTCHVFYWKDEERVSVLLLLFCLGHICSLFLISHFYFIFYFNRLM